ncbi:MAG TPA: ATP-binding protein [Nocardioidaceae bacterium]|nr:ATP-binding protein [Nocardioidaceae bacterium]
MASTPRRKVALALLIPLLLAATLGAILVRGDLIEAADSSSSAKQVTVLRPAVAYLAAAERAMVAAQVDSPASQAKLNAVQQDLKAAADDLETTRNSADLTPEQSRQVDVVLYLSRVLPEGGSDQLSAAAWEAQVAQLQSGVTQLITTIVSAQLDPEPRLEQLSQAIDGRFSLAMQEGQVATEAEVTGWTGSLGFFRELGAEGNAIGRLETALGESDPRIASLQAANAQRSSAVRLGGDDLGFAEAYTGYDKLITSLLDGIDQELDASASDARTRAFVYGAITLAALIAAILLALVVSRLLLDPIRKVREGALAKANEQLPDAVAKIRSGSDPGPIKPLDVTGDVEIGQVAVAVDDLHRQAVVLASREADLRSQVGNMFVSLSRRHNALINQQLDLIESLEKDEEDSRRLESLFRLDHLAARMRRTSESLLVLADAPPTRVESTDELTVSSALEAASAAVQDYKRVRVGSADSSRINDAAAADVVHILTELVDNALSYSPPDARVSLDSITTNDSVAVEIADNGLGIPSESLLELNKILHSGGEITSDTARRMGLFVVSRLAKRHGISVSLLGNLHGGITARVILPSAVLERDLPYDTGFPSTGMQTLGRLLPGQRNQSTARDHLGLDARISAATEMASAIAADSSGPPRSPDDASTPIFQAMRSAWLSADSDAPWLSTEVESGWDRADQVARSLGDAKVNAAGLPLRRPGNRLVPGGVTKAATTALRDPEEIRARLAAHAEGVLRGRRSAAGSDQSPTGANS